jgi:hypothetical protein
MKDDSAGLMMKDSHNSLALGVGSDVKLSSEHTLALGASRTRLEILLNPDEADTRLLLEAIDGMYDKANREKTEAVINVARRLLKREWVRIKNELSHVPVDD